MLSVVDRPDDMAWPPSALEWIMTVLCAIGGALAASSGVGGGVLFVPLMVIFAKIPVAYAAPVSNFVIAVSAVSTFVMNLFETHPKDAARPLINFEALIYFVPIAVSSTSLGVMLSRALPEWVVNALLFVFLGLTSVRMVSRAAKVYASEKASLAPATMRRDTSGVSMDEMGESDHLLTGPQAAATSAPVGATNGDKGSPQRKGPLASVEIGVLSGLRRDASFDDLQTSTTGDLFKADNPASGSIDPGDSKDLDLERERVGGDPKAAAPAPDERSASSPTSRGKGGLGGNGLGGNLLLNLRSTRWWYWAIIFGTWGLQVYLSIVQKRTRRCTGVNFLVLVGQPVIGVSIGLRIAQVLIGRTEAGGKGEQAREGAGASGDIALGESWATMGRMMVFCLGIGMLGGLLGVGGGSILAPLLLELGASAIVVAPISSSLVLFSSSQAAVQYAIGGKMLWRLAVWLGGVNLFANFVGLYLVKAIVRRLGFTSFIILSLGVLLVVATLFTGVFLVTNLVHHGFAPFPLYCR